MENLEKTAKWYVLRSASGKEAKVKEYIEQEMNNPVSPLYGHVSQVLIPTEKVYSVVNGKRVEKERLYLPGYVLIEARLNREIVGYLREFIPHCLGFLGFKIGKMPEPLRSVEVNKLLGLSVDEEQVSATSKDTFSVGDKVKVIEESFQGFSGVVEEVYEDKQKLKVMVTIFGRNTPIDLGFNQVVKEG